LNAKVISYRQLKNKKVGREMRKKHRLKNAGNVQASVNKQKICDRLFRRERLSFRRFGDKIRTEIQ
jgi:hypothetical protein